MPRQTFSVSDMATYMAATAHSILDDRLPQTHEGVIMQGQYDANEHTVSMKYGDMEAAALLSGNQTGIEGGAVLMSSYGDYYCPRGGERAVLMPSGGGGGSNVWLHHGNGEGVVLTDTPGTLGMTMQPGEKLHAHLTGDLVAPAIDTYTHYKNDGGTPGDKKGGIAALAGGRHAVATAGGHTQFMDDVLKQIQHKTAGGHYTLYDDAGRAISHVTSGGLKTLHSDITQEISHIAPNIGLGDIVSHLTSANAAINNSHLMTLAANINMLRRDDLVKNAAAMVAAGVPNAGAVIGQLAQLIGITVPAGSAITLIK